jgi:uncharacterized protein (DUF885 family)
MKSMVRGISLAVALAATLGLSGAQAREGAPATVAVTVPTSQALSPLDALVSDYEAWNLAQSPISAGQNGDRAALSKLPDVTPAADAARKAALEGFKARLDAIPAASLDADGQLNRAFLARLISDNLGYIAFDTGRFAFSSDDGFHLLAPYVATVTPINSVADAEAWLGRMGALAKYYDDNIANARRGIRTGWLQPRMISEIVLGQAQAALKIAPEADPLMTPFRAMSPAIAAAEQAALKARALAIITGQVRPAQQRFATFVEKEYLPKTKAALGVGSVPGGKDFYAFLARRFTTTSLTPDEIHALGEREVARIRAEMDAVRAEAGFSGTHAEFLAFLRSDPQFYVTTRQALLEKASEIAKRIDDQLPRYFGTLPRLPYGVRPVPAEIEKGYTSGRYFPGSASQGIAGGYMVNTYALDQRGLYELPALTLHEAVPGHHLQIALAQELEGVPAFRRDADMTAFVEGWALYSEKLGTGDGHLPDALREVRPAELRDVARLPAGVGHRHPLAGLERGNRPAQCFTENSAALGAEHRDRAGPLHLLAGTGHGLQDRRDEDPGAAPPGRGGAGRPVRHPPLPRRGAAGGTAADGPAGGADRRLDRGGEDADLDPRAFPVAVAGFGRAAAGEAVVKGLDRPAAGGLEQPGAEAVHHRGQAAGDHGEAEPGRDTQVLAVALADGVGVLGEGVHDRLRGCGVSQ